MIVCICNNIKESDLKKDPKLIFKCGTQCGKCKEVVKNEISRMRMQLVK